MRFSLLTIHPESLRGFFKEGILGKAADKEHLELECVNIRDYADPPHFHVDDKPYGGGPGMVLKPEPIIRALEDKTESTSKKRVIVLSAKGEPFTQKTAERLKHYDHLVLICGRYEGIDERVTEFYADEEIRVGDAVLMGGELAAAMIVESVARLVPGVIGNPESLVNESLSTAFDKEYPQYTRPESFEGKEVPKVLMSGDHKAVQSWREGSVQKAAS